MTTKPEDNRSLAESKEEQVIKLGLDVHAEQITICRQIGGCVPQPAQKMKWDPAIEWIKKQKESGARVYSCYEAGPCGYALHRTLEAQGVSNLVVVPRRLDELGKRVKTDKRDARELADRLDRHLRGNTEAFSIVLVPTPEQEQRRSLARQRGSLLKDRNRCVLRGHGMLLAQGIRARAGWWHPEKWSKLKATLPDWLREQIELWQAKVLLYEAESRKLDVKIRQFSEGKVLPKGLGTLTDALIESEILDWHRFKNRRQVGSYTGLCPSENTTGGPQRQGAINKHGNPRVRHQLVEAVWRLEKWQPDYPGLEILREARGRRDRKRAAVAAARRLAVDLWRISTGQCSAQQLGFRTVEAKA
jgi:transposase